MEIDDIQKALLKQNLRITPAMGGHILQQMESKNTGDISIIAGDAKTGVPLRTTINAVQLADLSTPQSPTQP